MSSELAKFGGGGLPVSPDDLVKGLQNVNQTLQGATGGTPFLRLLKSGYYAYGPENIEPEEGSQWAVNPYSLMHGFACWGEGELLGEVMVPFNQPTPPRAELPDYGQKWGQQVAMQLACLTGEDVGVNVLYKGTSTGLRNAMKKLIDQIIAKAQTDQVNIVPVVELDVDSYQHKNYGEIFVPILNVINWISMDDSNIEESEDEDDDADSDGEPADEGEAETKSEAAGNNRGGGRRRRRRAAADDSGDSKPADDSKPTQSSNRRSRRRRNG